MIKLAVVGVGWAGRRQVEAAQELGGKIEVVRLVDRDENHLKTTARDLGIDRTTTKLEDVLADPDIDAVSICTPHGLHSAQSLEAMSAGKHVLVEKPMATSVSEADNMIRGSADAGVCLYVAENEAYTPMSELLRRAYSSGELTGEVVSASVIHGFRAEVFRYPGRRDWLTRPEMGGTGTWTLHGIHLMARLRYVFGEVRSIYLSEHHASDFATPEIEGTMTGVVTVENGLPVTVLMSCETRLKGTLDGFRMYGTNGSLRASADGFEEFPTDGTGNTGIQPYPSYNLTSYAREIEAFADYVTDGKKGPTTAESERNSLAVVEAGYLSVKTGRVVTLPVNQV